MTSPVSLYAAPALITLLTVLLQLLMMANVGLARLKTGLQAPATVGDARFERAFRVQMNTIESTLMFLPALWVANLSMPRMAIMLLGGTWLVGRLLYAWSYMRKPDSRGPGFMVANIAILALLVGGGFGLLKAMTA